jgi:hypothetical protein
VFVRQVLKVAASAAVLGFLSSAAATAVTVSVTMTGTIDSATGTNAYAEGQDFVLSFEYDPDIFGSQSSQEPTYLNAVGGPAFAPALVSPIRRVSFSVPEAGHHEENFAPVDCAVGGCGQYGGVVAINEDGITSAFDLILEVGDSNPYFKTFSARVEMASGDIPFSLNTSFSLIGTGTISGSIVSTFDGELDGITLLTGSSFVVSAGPAPSPVPLPAGLPLLGAGIGGLALVARRKRL